MNVRKLWTHIYAGLVLFPELAALGLILIGLTFRMCGAVGGRGGDSRLKVALEPCVKAGVIGLFERCTLLRQ
jgi:hypothetical protein